MESEISNSTDSLQMVDICLQNYRASQLEQICGSTDDNIMIREVTIAVLFACHRELADFVLYIAGHNVHGLRCFQQYGFELSGQKRGQNSLFRVKPDINESENYMSFNQDSLQLLFSDYLSRHHGVKRPRLVEPNTSALYSIPTIEDMRKWGKILSCWKKEVSEALVEIYRLHQILRDKD